ncbi:DgyrCDS4974 [Dimorphilus gyrociliatus]|uniref:DgyrCDS4974 n=1 Tax=Dimorphilus gyrociliatus TaxID=2664684 RepID=A0A7I8VK04_9ANNE|nr:DgyrCDS4974 [Dimorphilus gyrociliatus]
MAANDWKKYVRWFTVCKLISKDHPINLPNSTLEEFINLLKDGVILCNLCNVLKPDILPLTHFSYRPNNSKFLSTRNINAFRETCSYFGLESKDIFEITDFFKVNGFPILRTLYKLSESKFSKDWDPYGYSLPEDENGSSPSRPGAIYINLSVSNSNREEEEDSIYQKLLGKTNLNSTDSTDGINYALNELLETEEIYLNKSLLPIKTFFMIPLKGKICESDHKIIFNGIDRLISFHKVFLQQLQEVINSKNNIGQIFLNNRVNFSMYGDYCANIPVIEDTLMKFSKANLQLFFDCEKNMSDSIDYCFSTMELLKVPMMRLTKYPLILSNLYLSDNYSPKEKGTIKKAQYAIEDILKYTNEMLRDTEMLINTSQIQKEVEGLLPSSQNLTDFGHFLLDGEFMIDDKRRYILLFDDVLFVLKKKQNNGNQYKVKRQYYLRDYKYSLLDNSKSKKWQYGIKLSSVDNPTEKLIINARDNTAFESLESSVKTLFEKFDHYFVKNHNFSLKTFQTKTPVFCNFCTYTLKGIIRQGYQCSNCFIKSHFECLNQGDKYDCIFNETKLGHTEDLTNMPWLDIHLYY